jgi:hypothetical protein
MFQEHVVLADGVLLELLFNSQASYCLACRKDGRLLVEFSSARRYAFKSVEKLRYDFESAVKDALRAG